MANIITDITDAITSAFNSITGGISGKVSEWFDSFITWLRKWLQKAEDKVVDFGQGLLDKAGLGNKSQKSSKTKVTDSKNGTKNIGQQVMEAADNNNPKGLNFCNENPDKQA
jgi:hypothetical protein